MSGRARGDQYIYGRYNDAIVWPLVALGIGWLLSARRPGDSLLAARRVVPIVVGAMAVTGGVVYVLHSDDIAEAGYESQMIAGMMAYVAGSPRIDILVVTACAIALFGLLAVTALLRSRGHALAVATSLASVLVVGGLRTHDGTGVLVNSGLYAAGAAEFNDVLIDGEPVGVMFVPNDHDPRPKTLRAAQARRAHYYQFFLDEHPMVEVEGPDPDDGIRYVFAPLDDPTMVRAAAVPVWKDPVIPMALWNEEPAE